MQRLSLLVAFLFIGPVRLLDAALVGSVNALDVDRNGNVWVGGAFRTDDHIYTNLVRIKFGSSDIDRSLQPLKILPAATPSRGQVISLQSLPDGDLIFSLFDGWLEGKKSLVRISESGSVRQNFANAVSTSEMVFVDLDSSSGILLTGSFRSASPRIFGMRLLDDGRIDPEARRATKWIAPDGRYLFFSSNNRFVLSDSDSDNATTNEHVTFGTPPKVLFRPDGRALLTYANLHESGTLNTNSINQLLPDGSLDPLFHPTGIIYGIACMALQPDGKLLLGGTFTNVLGHRVSNIARLNLDGSFDESFPALPGADGQVNAIAVDERGAAWFGGAFTNFNGQLSRALAVMPLLWSAAQETIGFRWTNVSAEEDAGAATVEIIRQGSGLGEVHAELVITFPGAESIIPISFAQNDLLPKRISIPLPTPDQTAAGNRTIDLALRDITGATLIENAERCRVKIRDAETGLLAEYYELPADAATSALGPAVLTTNMFGNVLFRGRESLVRFYWANQPPVAALQTNLFAAVWRGQFVPDSSGTHTFGAVADDGVRIWLGRATVFL